MSIFMDGTELFELNNILLLVPASLELLVLFVSYFKLYFSNHDSKMHNLGEIWPRIRCCPITVTSLETFEKGKARKMRKRIDRNKRISLKFV